MSRGRCLKRQNPVTAARREMGITIAVFSKVDRHVPPPSSEDFFSNVKGVLFDLDGVVYRGDEVIPGASEFFAYLG